MAEEQAGQAATKVHEAAANIQKPPRRAHVEGAQAEDVARRYFTAIGDHDLEAAVALWAAGGREHVRGQVDTTAPEGVRDFIGGLLSAVPDLRFEILSTTSEGDGCAVQWRLSGTFAGPDSFNGVAPTGDRVELEGIDLLYVRDGLIQSNDAYSDSMTFARQIGMMPPLHSTAEARLTGAFNVKTRLGSTFAGEAKLVASGVWVLQGQPGRCNVYLLEDEGGVTLFDAGGRMMTRALASAAARLGGLKRVVLGHSHTGHRGAAPGLGVPVLCHPDEVTDAEGSGGFRYWPADLAGLPTGARQLHRLLHRVAWDGGPVKISQTLSEGDQVAGFEVIHIPGHAPGQVALWRASDRLALVSDCFYTINLWARDRPPQLPLDLFNFDTAQARSSLLKLAEMEPAAAWPGHGNPVTGDVRGQLERAADR
jgi:glyoxylase-like metal-dependent hydrolase (beta-lactamase superfamily II)/predicted ester cyclase